MTDYRSLSGKFTAALALKQEPVAVCFTDHVPAGVPHVAERSPAGCRFWQEGSAKTFATSPDDHSLCAIGVYTHNLQPGRTHEEDLAESLRVFADLGYVRTEDLAAIPVLEVRPKHVIYGPLVEAPLTADVVLLFVNAAQSLLLSEATQQVENGNAPAMGRPACAVIPQVRNTGRAAVSLGCCGARAYLDVLRDDTAVFALPGRNLEVYANRVEALAKANAVLATFHGLRRKQVAEGRTPSVKESLAALTA